MSYDSEATEVWLDELTVDPGPVQEVCEFHAGRLTAPRGWTVSDRRLPPSGDELLPSGRRPATVATVAPAPPPAPEPPALEAPAPEVPAPDVPAPDVTGGADADPPGPVHDAPKGSLLARAFRSTGRRGDVPGGDGPTSEEAPT